MIASSNLCVSPSSPPQLLFLVLLLSLGSCRSQVTGDKTRFDRVLAQFGFHGLRQEVIGNFVNTGTELETAANSINDVGLVDEGDGDGDLMEVDVLDGYSMDPLVSPRRGVVRLGSDNRPYLLYADKKPGRKAIVRQASPLDVRKTVRKRRPKMILINQEGRPVAPKLMHLNRRIGPVYSFKSR